MNQKSKSKSDVVKQEKQLLAYQPPKMEVWRITPEEQKKFSDNKSQLLWAIIWMRLYLRKNPNSNPTSKA